jgi:glycosyltransferase involved in cell wall biosynthesis
MELFPQDIDRILFVPDLWIHKQIFYLSRYLPRRLSEATLGLLNQLITQFCQRRIVQQLVIKQKINIVHQPIPVAPRFPSALFDMGVPVVIGPLNGGMEYPPAFRHTESWISRTLLMVARMFSNAVNALLPGKKQASVVLVANQRTQRALPEGIHGKVVELVENGIDAKVWKASDVPVENATKRFVFIGRLVEWKAVDILIQAMEKLPLVELEVIGDGPKLESWRSFANRLGMADRVHFVGWLSQEECAIHLRDALALLLPSLYECGGAVVLEAMAMGKPVIATDWGGPADYLNASCGILVPPVSYSSLVRGFADAMQKMMVEPELARSMGIAGKERVLRDFDWQKKINQVVQIYQDLLEKHEALKVSGEDRLTPIVFS